MTIQIIIKKCFHFLVILPALGRCFGITTYALDEGTELRHLYRNNFYFEAKALESVLITTHNIIRVICYIHETFEAGNSLNLAEWRSSVNIRR